MAHHSNSHFKSVQLLLLLCKWDKIKVICNVQELAVLGKWYECPKWKGDRVDDQEHHIMRS